ncbi:MAG: hypothetical protein WCH99_20150 [Verrucomicrobiota bacterium]
MKKIWIAIAAVVVGLILTMAFVTIFFPLQYLFETTSITRVEIDKRNLRSVVQAIVSQVEAKKGKGFRVVYSPEKLGDNTRETTGGVFGNPPIEGKLNDALTIVAFDFNCHWSYFDRNTIRFYQE